MSQISNNPQSLNTLNRSQPQLGDSIAKQGFSLDDPALVGAAAGASGLDAASLSALMPLLKAASAQGVSGIAPAHSPGAPQMSGATTGYAAQLNGSPTAESGVQGGVLAMVGVSMQCVKDSAAAIAGYDQARAVAVENGQGKSTAGIPLHELSPADILNDPNLSFEEMLFKFMSVIANEEQNKVLDKMREIEAIGSGSTGAPGEDGGTPKRLDGQPQAQTAKDSGAQNFFHNIADGARGADPKQVAQTLRAISGVTMGIVTMFGPAIASTGPWGAAAVGALTAVTIGCFAASIAVDMGALDLLADGMDALGGDRKTEAAKKHNGAKLEASDETASEAFAGGEVPADSTTDVPVRTERLVAAEVTVPDLERSKQMQNTQKGGTPKRVTTTSSRTVELTTMGRRVDRVANPLVKPDSEASATGGKEVYDPHHYSELMSNVNNASEATRQTGDLRTTYNGKTAVEWKEEFRLYQEKLTAGELYIEGVTVLPDNSNGPDPKEVQRLTENMTLAASSRDGTYAGKTTREWDLELAEYKGAAKFEAAQKNASSNVETADDTAAMPTETKGAQGSGDVTPTSGGNDAPAVNDPAPANDPVANDPAPTTTTPTQAAPTTSGANAANAEGGGGSEESRALMMEELKFMTQQLSQMMQAISGVMNSQHESAMNTIRNIK